MRAAVLHNRFRIRLADLFSEAATIEWEGDGSRGAVVQVDAFQRGLVYLVVHEAVHFVKRFEAEKWGELEEPQVDGLSVELTRRIESSRKRMRWWRRAIRDKLEGAI